MKRIGITGGIGSGKSYVSKLFNQEYGIPIYCSDLRAKILMVEDRDLIKDIIKNFGEDSYINGQISKDKFNKLLFSDKQSLSLMNSLVIPCIEKDFNSFCQIFENEEVPYVLLESAILLETKTYQKLDQIICVVADFEIRMKRVMERDKMSKDLFLSKINNQSSDEEKIKISNYNIINNGQDLHSQIDLIHNSIINF